MPISCPIDVGPLNAGEFEELDYRVMGHAFASQNEIGRLCDEDAYQRDMRARLLADGFKSVQIEVPVAVSHADFSKTYSLDLVADNAVYELKTAATLNSVHQAQLLNYLFLTREWGQANRLELRNSQRLLTSLPASATRTLGP